MTAAPTPSPEGAAATPNELDADSLNAIRAILSEDSAMPARRSRGAAGAQPESETAARSNPPRESSAHRKADALPQLQQPDEDLRPDASEPRRSMLSRLRRKARKVPPAAGSAPRGIPRGAGRLSGFTAPGGISIAGYRPKRAHLAIAVLGLLVFFRPWLVAGLLGATGMLIGVVFLITGFDGFWRGVMRANRWYAKRRPARAAVVMGRLDRFAMRWDAVLDRFPEGTVDGLYLPDFADIAQADSRHDAAVARRLSGLQGKGI